MSDRRDLGIDTHRAEELVVGRDVLEGGAPQEAGEVDVPHLAALEGEPNTARLEDDDVDDVVERLSSHGSAPRTDV
jgi:hypothetical protein